MRTEFSFPVLCQYLYQEGSPTELGTVDAEAQKLKAQKGYYLLLLFLFSVQSKFKINAEEMCWSKRQVLLAAWPKEGSFFLSWCLFPVCLWAHWRYTVRAGGLSVLFADSLLKRKIMVFYIELYHLQTALLCIWVWSVYKHSAQGLLQISSLDKFAAIKQSVAYICWCMQLLTRDTDRLLVYLLLS